MSLAGMLPHQVEILYDFEGGANSTVCAGTIISSYLILTVFSCLAGRNESLFKIRANGKNQSESQIRTIDQVFSYAAVDSDPSPFDVAIIQLNSELELDKTHTSKIRYAQEDFSDETTICRERGVVEVRSITQSECSTILKEKGDTNFICTEPLENREPPLAGSGLICSGVLSGLLAVNSSTEAEARGKRVYTSVAKYSHWIQLVFDDGDDDEKISHTFTDDESAHLADLGATSFGGKVVDQIKSPVPYQLSIRYKGNHVCGGIILDKKTALSAAHCFDPKLLKVRSLNISSFLVVAGEQNLNKNDSTEQIFQIKNLFKHPNYTHFLKGNDIAVIRIKGEFNFTDRVNNVWISSPSTPDFEDVNGTATATGWGKTTTAGGPSPILLSVDLDFLEHSRCKRQWGFLKDSMLCGYNNVSNVCEGDSGGPLVIKNYMDAEDNQKDLLVGINSFGPRECEKRNMPNGFTNFTHFYEWIAEVRSNSLCSSSQFQCFNGECIKKNRKCNKKFDCADGSDERMCECHTNTTGNGNGEELESQETVDYDNLANQLGLAPGRVNASSPIPYQLSLQYQTKDGFQDVCGAVILDKNTAITAAHCVQTRQNWTFFVVAGKTELDDWYKKYPVRKVIIHPDYSDFRNGSDIAILHVDTMHFYKDVQPVWLPPFPSQKLSHMTAVISGWSKALYTYKLSNSLLLGKVSILPPEDCLYQLSRMRGVNVTAGVVCASDELARTCGGDSGGPLVIKNYPLGNSVGNLLVGISSFGPETCSRQHTTVVFTEVSHFYHWIQENRFAKPCDSVENMLPCISSTRKCYHKDWECDGDRDCPDGTDEINCIAKRISNACGGFINLAQSPQHEIIYQVPSKERQRDSVCLWIVSTGRQDSRASIEATILHNPSAQFNPDSDVIFTQYKFTQLNSTLNAVRTKYIVPGPFMTVYYRTNSSAPNAGFHLKLKDSIVESEITERLDVKVIEIPNADSSQGKPQEFSYPSSVSGASIYSSDERTFFILKPQKSGAKIRLNLTFVDTEEKYDWLQINSFRTAPFSLFRFSGWSTFTEQIFEGLEDEPFLFYFQSDGSVERDGFKIQYSEMMPKTSPCGGFIRFGGEQEILYKVPENLRGEKSVCVWVVAAATGSSIETELLSNPRAHFEPEESDLYAIFDFTIRSFSHHSRWAKDQKWTVEKPFFVLYFRTSSSNPNSGFHIRLKEVGKIEDPGTVKYLELKDDATSAIQEFKYPQPPASKYKDNERTFIIVKPGTPRGKLKLDLKSVSTEKDYDWMDVLTVESEPTSEFRFHGQDSWSNRVFEAENDEPFIVYFHSDTSNTDAGFQFSYAEQSKK